MLHLADVGVELNGREVLAGIDLHIAPGERVVLLGVNGSGKTTLLRAMDGLVAASRGTVRYDGQVLSPRTLGDEAFRRRFRSEVSLLFQNVDAMLFCPTVADEVAFGPRQLCLHDIDARMAQLIAQLSLDALMTLAPFDLSGGEKKRVALAAVLATAPRLLLLDEPTANLDPRTAATVVDLIAGMRDVTVVSATHNLSVAEDLGTRAVVLAPGRTGMLFDGPLADFVRDENLLVESGLAHRHGHQHGAVKHVHFHVHTGD